MTQLIIDADTHLTEPPDVWISRVPKKYLEHVPHMERTDDGRDVWVLDGVPFSSPGLTAVAGWPEPFPSGPKTLDECPLAAYDADARLRYMDEVGIWAQVLYPNVAGFGSQRFLMIPDDELKLVCVRAYNDFLRDWASADARRLLTIMTIPFWDIDEAVKEIGATSIAATAGSSSPVSRTASGCRSSATTTGTRCGRSLRRRVCRSTSTSGAAR